MPRFGILFTFCVMISVFSGGVLSDEIRFMLGDDFSAEEYMAVPKGAPLARGDFSDLPSAHSLKAFAPKIGNQGSSGSCVGWASAYAAATIALNIQASYSEPELSRNAGFSPAYIFNQVKRSEDCSGGSYIPDALNFLSHYGVLPLSEFPYSDKTCNSFPNPQESRRAGNFTIKDFRRIGSVESMRSVHVATRKAIAENRPVVIGMLVGNTFQAYRGNGDALMFKDDDYEVLEEYGIDGMSELEGWGGHAMTVIAYDDNRGGGSFQIMNSWSQSWGDNGTAWVRYEDFRKWVRSAFEVMPPDPIVPPKPKEPNFASKIQLFGLRGDKLSTRFSHGNIELSKALPSRSMLRAEISASADNYTYIIGADDSSNEFSILFPYKKDVSPYIAAHNTMLLPGPTEDYFSRLDEQAGTDYFVVLQSPSPIDIDALKAALLRQGSGSVKLKLQKVLGDKIVSEEKVNRRTPGDLSLYLTGASVVATIVEIKHLAESVKDVDKNEPVIVLMEPALDNVDASINAAELLVSGTELTIKGIAQDENEIVALTIAESKELKFSSRGPFQAVIDLQGMKVGDIKNISIEAIDAADNKKIQQFKLKMSK